MALSNADRQFLINLRDQGVSKEEAITRLEKVRQFQQQQAGPFLPAEVAKQRGAGAGAVKPSQRGEFERLPQQTGASEGLLQGPVMPAQVAAQQGRQQDVISDVLEERVQEEATLRPQQATAGKRNVEEVSRTGREIASGLESFKEGVSRGLLSASELPQKAVAGAARALVGENPVTSGIEEGLGLGERAKELSKQRATEFTEELQASPTAAEITGAVGEFAPSIAATAPIAPAATLPRTGIQALKFLGRSLGATTAIEGLTEGQLPTLEDITLGAGIDVFLPLSGELAGKGAGLIGESLLKRTPTELAIDATRGFDLGKRLSETVGPRFTRKQLITAVNDNIATVSKELDDAIAIAEKSFTPRKAEEIANIALDSTDAIKKTFGNLGLEEAKRMENAMLDKALGFIQSNPGDLGLSEIQGLKKEVGQGLQSRNFFTKLFQQPDKVIQAGDAVNNKIREELARTINQNVPGAEEANRILSELITVRKGLEKDSNFTRRLFTNIVGAGFASGGAGGIDEAMNNPLNFAKNFIIGGMIFNGLNRTFPKSTSMSALEQASKGLKSATTRQAIKASTTQEN